MSHANVPEVDDTAQVGRLPVPATQSQASLVRHLNQPAPNVPEPAPAALRAARPSRLRRFRARITAVKLVLATRNGKLVAVAVYTIIQVGVITALLILSSEWANPVDPTQSQWQACPRHLNVFVIIQVFKALLGWTVQTWYYLRPPEETRPPHMWGRVALGIRQDVLPYFTAILHLVLSALLFSSLTLNPTSYATSPLIFFACVMALARTWLGVAEGVLLVIGGAIYAICYATLAIFCPSLLTRRRGGAGINPAIGPLSGSEIGLIPTVHYASMSAVSLVLPAAPQRTFSGLWGKKDNNGQSSGKPVRHKIERHRAVCAICLTDFVDPRKPRRVSTSSTAADPEQGAAEPSSTNEVTEPEDLRLLPCSHVFHKDCIDPWRRGDSVESGSRRREVNRLRTRFRRSTSIQLSARFTSRFTEQNRDLDRRPESQVNRLLRPPQMTAPPPLNVASATGKAVSRRKAGWQR